MKWSNAPKFTPYTLANCSCFQTHKFTKLPENESDEQEKAPISKTERAYKCIKDCCCCCCLYPSSIVVRTLAAISIIVLIAAVHPNHTPCEVVDLVYMPAYTVSGRPVYGIRATLRELVYNTTLGTKIVVVPRTDADLMAALDVWHQNSTHACAYNKLTGVLRVGMFAMENSAAAWTIFCVIMSVLAVSYMLLADMVGRNLLRKQQHIHGRNNHYQTNLFELSELQDGVSKICKHCKQPIDPADTNNKLVWCKWGCKLVYHKECVEIIGEDGTIRPRKCICGHETMFDYSTLDESVIDV
jgi:hypothetical protein